MKFEAGKTYWTTSIGDSECIWTITVLRRTAKTLYVTDENGNAKTLRVKVDTYDGGETVAPKGNYSMSPTISASKEGDRWARPGLSMPAPSHEPEDFDDPLRFMHRMG
jgi:hypothetical protein